MNTFKVLDLRTEQAITGSVITGKICFTVTYQVKEFIRSYKIGIFSSINLYNIAQQRPNIINKLITDM